MIEFSNGGRLVENISELPRFGGRSIKCLYADFETTSHNPKLKSTNPWSNCWAAGIGVTADECPEAYYIPIRHVFGINLPEQVVIDWWDELTSRSEMWVNHHVKYDAHVSTNALGVLPPAALFCTMTHAKIIDSDMMPYKGGYGIDNLSRRWLAHDISQYEARLKPYLAANKDYGRIPADICGEYCCQDVITARRLHRFIMQTRPEQCKRVADIETELTTVLYNIERTGMCVDATELQIAEVETIYQMLHLDETLHKLVGRTVNAVSRDDVFDVLCNQFGLPVLAWTEEPEDEDDEPAGNPSFNKYALKSYLEHPYAPKEIVQAIVDYRECSTFKSLFLQKYQELVFNDGRLHSSYNQCLRTGRLGCKDPNAQQLNKKAKTLIHAPAGCSVLTYDSSQIEFRIIAEICEAHDVLISYAQNPDTDFHQWVADMAQMSRRPAKTMNFMMGYGGGKKKAVKTLKGSTEVIGDVRHEVDALVKSGAIAKEDEMRIFEMRCVNRAELVYDRYHATLPTLKRTARAAGDTCRERGYVFNRYGRRRHLSPEFSHKAFNSLCQGFAADIQKDRTCAAARATRGTPITMFANVHDETAFYAPQELAHDRRVQIALAYLLEHPDVELNVPLRVSCGVSDKHWAEASGDNPSLHYTADELKWLEAHRDDPLYFLK